jgi:hypothetical protein
MSISSGENTKSGFLLHSKQGKRRDEMKSSVKEKRTDLNPKEKREKRQPPKPGGG